MKLQIKKGLNKIRDQIREIKKISGEIKEARIKIEKKIKEVEKKIKEASIFVFKKLLLFLFFLPPLLVSLGIRNNEKTITFFSILACWMLLLFLRLIKAEEKSKRKEATTEELLKDLDEIDKKLYQQAKELAKERGVKIEG
jgi:hypothetical protein